MVQVRVFLVCAVIVSAIAAYSDWRKGIIPPWLSMGALTIAPVAHGILGGIYGGKAGALEGVVMSLAGAALCGAIPLLLYYLGGGKGGDVKLLAAIGAICRPMIGIEAEFYGFIAASIFALGRLAYDGKLFATLLNSLSLLVNPFLPRSRRRPLSREAMTWTRLGPAVFVGACLAAFLNWRPI